MICKQMIGSIVGFMVYIDLVMASICEVEGSSYAYKTVLKVISIVLTIFVTPLVVVAWILAIPNKVVFFI